MIAILTLLVFFCAVGISEGMDQRVPLCDGREQNLYHGARTVATWCAVLAVIAVDRSAWYVYLIAGLAYDGIYNRFLQATRVLFVGRQPVSVAILTACDIDRSKPVPFWAWKHYRWWFDWAFFAAGTPVAFFLMINR